MIFFIFPLCSLRANIVLGFSFRLHVRSGVLGGCFIRKNRSKAVHLAFIQTFSSFGGDGNCDFYVHFLAIKRIFLKTERCDCDFSRMNRFDGGSFNYTRDLGTMYL